MVGVSPGENLRFVFQAAKCARVDNAVAVTFIVVAVRMRRLPVPPALRFFHSHGVRCKLAMIVAPHRVR